MKVAVIGSRSRTVENLGLYLPPDTTEIVSGGAAGIDQCARAYALAHEIKLVEFRPDYAKYGRAAPIRQNDEIIAYADLVLAFWDGVSKGTDYVIQQCRKQNKKVLVHLLADGAK